MIEMIPTGPSEQVLGLRIRGPIERTEVEREAIVADPGWMASLAKIGDPLPAIEVRHFSRDQRDEALKWINA
ncbi:MAG: STAS/SEC14 domain-containing protein [Thiocapsa sp.]|jgi:hypothetical protein|nr:STAS/SEC14 domain-containing protein [Thiocapsa sp.]MCG6985914.1 STAS/SEC14 domain-containing protein [Thiocapsa sp.]